MLYLSFLKCSFRMLDQIHPIFKLKLIFRVFAEKILFEQNLEKINVFFSLFLRNRKLDRLDLKYWKYWEKKLFLSKFSPIGFFFFIKKWEINFFDFFYKNKKFVPFRKSIKNKSLYLSTFKLFFCKLFNSSIFCEKKNYTKDWIFHLFVNLVTNSKNKCNFEFFFEKCEKKDQYLKLFFNVTRSNEIN